MSFVGNITGDDKVGNGIVRCVIGRSARCHLLGISLAMARWVMRWLQESKKGNLLMILFSVINGMEGYCTVGCFASEFGKHSLPAYVVYFVQNDIVCASMR